MQEWHADAFRSSSQSLCGSVSRPNYPSSCGQGATGGNQAQGGQYKPKVTPEEERDGSTPSPSCAVSGWEAAPADAASTQANNFTTTLCYCWQRWQQYPISNPISCCIPSFPLFSIEFPLLPLTLPVFEVIWTNENNNPVKRSCKSWKSPLMAVIVDLCKPNRKMQRCGFATNQLTNQIKGMLL